MSWAERKNQQSKEEAIMSKKILICAVLMCFALSANVALSGMAYLPEMNQVAAPYPGATIVQTTSASGTVMVMMQSDDNLDAILDYYKKELPANGWTISAETQSQDHSGLMGEKGANSTVVNLSSGQAGKSLIMLMLAPKK